MWGVIEKRPDEARQDKRKTRQGGQEKTKCGGRGGKCGGSLKRDQMRQGRTRERHDKVGKTKCGAKWMSVPDAKTRGIHF